MLLKAAINTATDEFSAYFRESTRPLANLLLIAPLLAFYELAAAFRPAMTRSTAESWFHAGFRWVGLPPEVSQSFLLPLLICAAIVGVHYATRRPWRIPWRLMPAMICEAILGGILLVALLQLIVSLTSLISVQSQAPSLTINSFAPSRAGTWVSLFSFIGSGLYEEVFFRAMMITPIAWSLRQLGETRRMSWIAAAVVSSLFFALAHYHSMNITREQFHWFTFAFRMSAGVLFSALYITRGLGITVGAHVAYDVLIAMGSSG